MTLSRSWPSASDLECPGAMCTDRHPYTWKWCYRQTVTSTEVQKQNTTWAYTPPDVTSIAHMGHAAELTSPLSSSSLNPHLIMVEVVGFSTQIILGAMLLVAWYSPKWLARPRVVPKPLTLEIGKKTQGLLCCPDWHSWSPTLELGLGLGLEWLDLNPKEPGQVQPEAVRWAHLPIGPPPMGRIKRGWCIVDWMVFMGLLNKSAINKSATCGWKIYWCELMWNEYKTTLNNLAISLLDFKIFYYYY